MNRRRGTPPALGLLAVALLALAPRRPLAAPAGTGAGEAAPAEPSGSAADDSGTAALQSEVESLKEQADETRDRVEQLRRLRLGGYVQGRYQLRRGGGGSQPIAFDPATGTPVAGTAPAVETAADEGFSVARGRFDAQYESTWGIFRLQIDAVPSGVSLRDAEARLKLPRALGTASLGQMKWPFGYESQQSSAFRELPERSQVVEAFLPGQRDRGVRLDLHGGLFTLQGGVFNGNGTVNTLANPEGFTGDPATLPPRPAGRDNDGSKDVIGRLGADLGWLAAGVSGWWGETFRPGSTGLPGSRGGRFYPRTRVGADAQTALDLVFVGRTVVKAEWIAGQTPFAGGAEQFDEGGRARSANGYYVLLVQNVGLSDAVAFRFDRFDPRSGSPNQESPPGGPGVPPADNAIHTYGFAVVHHFDAVLKATLAYEIPVREARGADRDPLDDLFTVQLQAQF
jgi:hypothetical protein